jgi:CRISPR-associated Cas5-like protein
MELKRQGATEMENKVWLKGEYEFASLFSYRLPDFSSAYAPSSPMPGPSAVKLALVATAIESHGKVQDGEELYTKLCNAKIGLETSSELAISRLLIKRLKQQPASKAKSEITGRCEQCGKENQKLYKVEELLLCRNCGSGIAATFATREYVHFNGPVSIYIEINKQDADMLKRIMSLLRRIGTSDSLLYCRNVTESSPNAALIARDTLEFSSLISSFADLAGRPAYRLKDIREGTTFSQLNPFSGIDAKNALEAKIFVFPLRIQKQGKNWVWYKLEPFTS